MATGIHTLTSHDMVNQNAEQAQRKCKQKLLDVILIIHTSTSPGESLLHHFASEVRQDQHTVIKVHHI